MVHEPHQAPRRKKMINIQVLRTQKHLVEKHIAEGKHILYCYLRAKSSKTSGLGTPYYIGIASLAERPYMRHEWRDSTGRRRSVPVPKEEALIRIVDVLETREDAQQREQFFIAWYGRRLIDEGGILLNRSSGGRVWKLREQSTQAKSCNMELRKRECRKAGHLARCIRTHSQARQGSIFAILLKISRQGHRNY